MSEQLYDKDKVWTDNCAGTAVLMKIYEQLNVCMKYRYLYIGGLHKTNTMRRLKWLLTTKELLALNIRL